MAGAAAAADPPVQETNTPPAEGGGAAPAAKPAAPSPKPAEGGAARAPVSGGAEDVDDTPLGVSEKDGRKFIKMPYGDFKERLGKATRKKLREMFGTSDEKAILEIKKKYDEFEKDADERKKAEMTERQKLEVEKNEALTARDIAQRRADRAKDQVQRTKTEKVVTRGAREHIHPDHLDAAVALFRVEIAGMSRKKADKLVGHEAEWFADLVAKKPQYAKASGATETPAKEERTKRPASNGIDPKSAGKKPDPTPPSSAGGKKVSEMSKSELKEYAAKHNIKLPSDLNFLG